MATTAVVCRNHSMQRQQQPWQGQLCCSSLLFERRLHCSCCKGISPHRLAPDASPTSVDILQQPETCAKGAVRGGSGCQCRVLQHSHADPCMRWSSICYSSWSGSAALLRSKGTHLRLASRCAMLRRKTSWQYPFPNTRARLLWSCLLATCHSAGCCSWSCLLTRCRSLSCCGVPRLITSCRLLALRRAALAHQLSFCWLLRRAPVKASHRDVSLPPARSV